MSEKKSGAQFRKERRAREKFEAETERERVGLNDMWKRVLERVGPAPLDPVGNSEWANNMAAAMAEIIANDETIPLPDRFKRVAELLDRIAYTQQKAVTSKRIREVKEGAGVVSPKDRQHADGVIQVGGSPALRAGRDTRGAVAVPGSVPGVPSQKDGT